jgi:hypothetical protein
MARLARPRLIALKAALAVGGFSGMLSAVALASAGGVIDQKQPGAVGEISGQTPAQSAQAQQAPITPSVEVADYGWWEPGSGKSLSATVNYPDANGLVGLLNAGGAVTTMGHPFFAPFG